MAAVTLLLVLRVQAGTSCASGVAGSCQQGWLWMEGVALGCFPEAVWWWYHTAVSDM